MNEELSRIAGIGALLATLSCGLVGSAVAADVAGGDVAATDVVKRADLSLAGAQHVIAAARAYAREHAAPGAAIAIVDAGGQPIALVRLDGTFLASSEISIGKARTAVAFGRPTRDLEDTINKGRTAMTPVAAVTWFTPLKGGVPIVVDGQTVGAIGVSGAASAQQDDEIASAGAANFATTHVAGEVTFVSREALGKAFAESETGASVAKGDGFVVNASRRDRAGEGEVHERQTDVFYVISGRATLVTGGTLRSGRQSGPGEWRGAGIDGGTERQLDAGTVVVIPRGTPHWFRAVATPLRYFVVKVTDAD